MQDDRTTRLVHQIETACLWEAEAPKAGNVHPDASFDDLTHDDFVRSARITAFMLSRIETRGVSQSILDAVRAVRLQVGKNTNLGIVLLLAPLAAVRDQQSLCQTIPLVIDSLDIDDSRKIYEAINLAQPGGMSQVEDQDLATTPSKKTRQLMLLAQNRDLIARQYANNFHDVLGFGLERLAHWISISDGNRNRAIVGLHLDWMAHYPDSLIARKCGEAVAEQARSRAEAILKNDWPSSPRAQDQFAEFDRWLRADGNKRNPGTTADLVAASLFAGLREGIIS